MLAVMAMKQKVDSGMVIQQTTSKIVCNVGWTMISHLNNNNVYNLAYSNDKRVVKCTTYMQRSTRQWAGKYVKPAYNRSMMKNASRNNSNCLANVSQANEQQVLPTLEHSLQSTSKQ